MEASMSDKEPQMTVVAPRGRGRPKVTEPRTTLCTWMEARHYDQIVKMAIQQEKSVSALVRDLLVLRLK
jgi:hypothetical protein